MNVLFICRGNVGRSAMAEAIFNELAPSEHKATSAGTKLSGPEQPLRELKPAIDSVLTVMDEEGIDVSEHIRRQVTEEMIEGADKVVLVVDSEDPVPEYLIDNPKVLRWDVLDPKGQSLEFTRATRDQIRALIEDLMTTL